MNTKTERFPALRSQEDIRLDYRRSLEHARMVDRLVLCAAAALAVLGAWATTLLTVS